MSLRRRKAILSGLGLALAPTAVLAQRDAPMPKFFRIGTGGVAGTYYPIGGLVAEVISSPPGARSCARGGSCGVPGLIAAAVASEGSIDNVEALGMGTVESCFAQADVVYWAHYGENMFNDREPMKDLRALASLYPEVLHIVVLKPDEIETITDLKGKRVALGSRGSGTLAQARAILEAHGVPEDAMDPIYSSSSQALQMMREGELDAFCLIAGYPTRAVEEAVGQLGAGLLSLDPDQINMLAHSVGFFTASTIPAGTYQGVGSVDSISIMAQWVTTSRMDNDLIEAIVEALWHPNSRAYLDSGHPQAAEITLETALDGLAVPLHEGAKRFYDAADVAPVSFRSTAD
ncbi:MAG: TAXI family TRAP transporter solute-binding subunit [Geminicoccaceae bacterium]